MQLSTLNFGIALVYWIDFAFSSHEQSFAWRVPVILQCVFLIPMLLLLVLIPESPRWLAAHDRPDEALTVLHRLRGGNDEDISYSTRKLHQEILKTVALEVSIGAGSWKDLLKNDHIQSQKRFLIACAIQIFQQLSGINAVVCESKKRLSLLRLRLLTRLQRLCRDAVSEQYRLRSAYVFSDVWLSTDVVLRRLIHSLVPDRSHW
jgi:hypothetical protein